MKPKPCSTPVLNYWDTTATICALHPDIVEKKFNHVPVKINLMPGKNYAGIFVVKNSRHTVSIFYRIDKNLFYQK